MHTTATSTATSLGLLIALSIGASACSISFGSDSVTDAAERAIEDELGEQLGLELSDADCEAPESDEPGATFSCSASADGDATVTIDAVVEPDDGVFVAASNVIIADDMETVEREAVITLAPEVNLPEERIAAECPTGPVVLDDGVLICEITDTSTGQRFELIVEVSDFVLREGFTNRFYRVGEQIE